MIEKPAKQVSGKKPLPEEAKPYRWKKGQSGNPAGAKPLEKRFGATARELLQATTLDIELELPNGKKKVISLKSTKNFYHGLVAALIVEGLQGNVPAIKELIDRADGKVPDRIDMQTKVMDDTHRRENETVRDAIDGLESEDKRRIVEALRLARSGVVAGSA